MKIGRVSSASVLKCTGKNWDEWIDILDRAGAAASTHQEIVAHLKKKHRLSPWWQQGVALAYELATGKRIEGQNSKGEYTLTATRSLKASRQKIWNLLSSPEGLAVWLKPLSDFDLSAGESFETTDGAFGEVRTLKKTERVRLSWQIEDQEKPTTVQVFIVARPGQNSILAFGHEGILSARLQEQLRVRWKNALSEIARLIE